MNKVQIIADSKNEFGQRLITAILTFPRYLLAEVNTHRMLSRNSASSRAIRFEKMVESVMNNPFIPFKWQKDHAGMQGSEYFEEGYKFEFPCSDSINGFDINSPEYVWLKGRDKAVKFASILNKEGGVTKQIANRMLEPYMYHTALVSGTELENFFALRAQDAAEIHFQDLAYKFLDACNESTPKELKAGEWHIPYGDDLNVSTLVLLAHANITKHKPDYSPSTVEVQAEIDKLSVKIATVRAARISYAVPGSEMKHDYEADLKLHDRLASSGHWSAFEHCAQAMSKDEFGMYYSGKSAYLKASGGVFPYAAYGWCGNFRGFIQYRKMFDNENRSDSRLIQK